MSTCKVSICDKNATGSRGYCSSHYAWSKRIGHDRCPFYVVGTTPTRTKVPCKVDVCSRYRHANGLCFPHYQFKRRNGVEPSYPLQDQRPTTREQKREALWSIKERSSCEVCGENRTPTLVFHHRNPDDKEFSVAYAIAHKYRWGRILRELEKCDVLCANCHRMEHNG